MVSEHHENTSNAPAIALADIKKSFTARHVLHHIDLSIDAGQSLCLLGINGAGKSTLLRIIAGLIRPDQGSVHINGCNMTAEPDKNKSRLGVISHKSMTYPDLTILENILFFAKLYGVKNPKEKTERILENLGLAPYAYDQARILSRGMLQRLAIARALVHDPQILLADEPFTGLDADSTRYFVQVLTTFSRNGGTVMMTTHDTAMGLRCCDRVVVLEKGDLCFDAPTSTIDKAHFSEDYMAYVRNKQ